MATTTPRNLHPLAEKWPSLVECLSPLTLGKWPTPVERITLQVQGRDLSLWVKREDRSSRLYGGNKLRKLEWILARRPERVITIGPLGSHHVLATTLHAASIGAATTAILVPQSLDDHHLAVHRLILRHAERVISLKNIHEAGRVVGRIVRGWSQLHPGSHLPLFIPPGGSSPLGTLGFVAAGLEIAASIERGECDAVRRIYVPLGTGGTAVGLAIGLMASNVPTQVVAVRVASRAAGNMPYLLTLAGRTRAVAQRAGISLPEGPLPIQIDHRFIGKGYAVPTQEGYEALELARMAELQLETTYTAKTLAALIADVRANPDLGPLMFIDTYGPIDHLLQNASTK